MLLKQRWFLEANVNSSPFSPCMCNDSHKRSFSKVYPLSLLAFSSASHSLSLSRHPSSSAIHLGRDEKGKAQLKGLDHLFRCHLKPKKQHEIKLLGEVIYWLYDVLVVFQRFEISHLFIVLYRKLFTHTHLPMGREKGSNSGIGSLAPNIFLVIIKSGITGMALLERWS